jgi:hypothetical protein
LRVTSRGLGDVYKRQVKLTVAAENRIKELIYKQLLWEAVWT